jgi:hypothetical protein
LGEEEISQELDALQFAGLVCVRYDGWNSLTIKCTSTKTTAHKEARCELLNDISMQ